MTDVFPAETRDQPRLLRRLGARREELWSRAGPPPRRLWLTGCGDVSMAAGAAAAAGECVFGRDVRALRSMDLRWWRTALRRDDLLVAASVSGRTPRTLEALCLAREAGARTLAITDDPRSPLAAAAGEVFHLDTAPLEVLGDHEYPGYASEVPQTRTYLAVLWSFLTLAQASTTDAWDAGLADRLQECMDPLHRAAASLAREMVREPVREVVVLGSGVHAATAAYGAAKLLEYAIPARAQCIEEFHHLEMFTVARGDWLVALTPDSASAQRFAEVSGVHEELGARSVQWHAGAGGSLPPDSLPTSLFTGALALQWHAFHLARALGRDVNRWVGGVRRDQIFRLSQRTIRDSRLWTSGPAAAPPTDPT